MYVYVWEYRVGPEHRDEFLRHYRPGGTWARLFGRAPAYVGTDLLHDAADPTRYVTVDRWEDEAAFRAFRARFAAEFDDLDRRCAGLTSAEVPLGRYATVPAADSRS
jgi:heme-degrading monooxygenase HmoA